MTSEPAAVLDDMVSAALAGPQADLAERSEDGRARRYRPDVAPFCGVERLDDSGWVALGGLVGPGGVAVLLRAGIPPTPPGWDELVREPATQYVATDLAPPPPGSEDVVELGAADSPDMLALATATEPGPFGPETHRTGRWFGVRRDGRLVAMAGERFRAPGCSEVSGVCVDSSARGSGLGAVVTLAVARAIEARGDLPVLHVREGNDAAHRLYVRCGFAIRREVDVVVARRTFPA